MKFEDKILEAGSEGIVLLKNEGGILPLLKDEKVSVFGRCQFDFYRSGMGSGGSVHVPYTTNLTDCLDQVCVNKDLYSMYKEFIRNNPFDNGGGMWAGEPFCQKEMEVTDEIAVKASQFSKKAIYVVGRTAGEDKDFRREKGSWYLSDEEEKSLAAVCRHFGQVAVLFNTPGIIDMSFLSKKEYESVQSVLYVWQGGQESGRAAANVVMGKTYPSGKLSDTIACSIEDYPSTEHFLSPEKNYYVEDVYVGYRYFLTFAKDKILYPFGFGLGYTRFGVDFVSCSFDEKSFGGIARFNVRNEGNFAGKEVVQLYVEGPKTNLPKPSKVLVGFEKTCSLNPGESCEIEVPFNLKSVASYDDASAAGVVNSWVLEAGKYAVHCGTDSLDTKVAFEITLESAWCEKLEQACAPVEPFKRMWGASMEDAPLSKVDLKKRIEDNLPKEFAKTGRNIDFDELKKNPESIDDFVSLLSVNELCAIVRGEGMLSRKVTPGIAAAYGGVTPSLHDRKIPVAGCSDGPSGIRMDTGKEANLMPIGTQLACTWNLRLIEELYEFEGQELCDNGIDTLLGPGMNIHRNPLGGRNFEYFSEDPYLTGMVAVAELKGLASKGVAGTIKHFAANSQELNRSGADSIVSERALREIYLKAFEIAVKSGFCHSIMTSYNPVNGHWAASNYDLVNTILRKEWKFDGLVMTDWWAKMNHCVDGGKASVKNTAYMVRARNDVYMVVDNDGAETNCYKDNIEECLSAGELTVAELQVCAKDIIKFLLWANVSKKPLRPLLIVKEFEPDTSIEAEADVKAEQEFECAGKDVLFEAEENAVYNIQVVFSKEDDGTLSQSAVCILLNGKTAASIDCRTTNGKYVFVHADQVMLKKGKYRVNVDHVRPGINIKNISLSCINHSPVTEGWVD